jgi:hypothetical protein
VRCLKCRVCFQQRQEDGADPAAQHGGSRGGPDPDAQLPTVRIESLKSLLLKVQHIMQPVNPIAQYSFHLSRRSDDVLANIIAALIY